MDGDRATFRQEIRDWLQAQHPPREEDGRIDLARWTEIMHSAGLLCVAWPTEYGGRGLTAVEVAILNEEFAKAGVPRATRGMGEWMVGPSVMTHGTDEQRQRLLPRIADGSDQYCQGFSEPDAGSDLASIRTSATIDGDELVISGQKIWTSLAHGSNMMFCLCRTDAEAPPHRGLTYVLVPMKRVDGAPNGVEISPIRQMTGHREFNAVFLDGTRAPLSNVIGGLGNGWKVAMTTLASERGGKATTQHLRFERQFWNAVRLLDPVSRAKDAFLRDEAARMYTQVQLIRIAGLRIMADVLQGRQPGPAASLNKMLWSEYQQRATSAFIRWRGPEGVVIHSGGDYDLDDQQYEFLMARSATIWGGTAEVQRNIVAERVLGLPK